MWGSCIDSSPRNTFYDLDPQRGGFTDYDDVERKEDWDEDQKYPMIEEIQPSLRLNEMSQLAFGIALPVKVAWGPSLKNIIKEALIAGYRHIDTAVRYSTQAFMAGAPPNNSEEYYTAFKEGIKDSGVDRKDIWITFELSNRANSKLKFR